MESVDVLTPEDMVVKSTRKRSSKKKKKDRERANQGHTTMLELTRDSRQSDDSDPAPLATEIGGEK